MQAIAHR